jgi:hypothetical protein
MLVDTCAIDAIRSIVAKALAGIFERHLDGRPPLIHPGPRIDARVTRQGQRTDEGALNKVCVQTVVHAIDLLAGVAANIGSLDSDVAIDLVAPEWAISESGD